MEPYKIQAWCTPEDVNWMMWMGQQIKDKKEFNADDYFRWRKYYPYCAGLLSDLFPAQAAPLPARHGQSSIPSPRRLYWDTQGGDGQAHARYTVA